ncbi:hypothetical protein CEXT_647651 [Caerostris extrusa]|uniref:Uncharacterized protein n=1 Tax=Caerostris extrusa TaxID=172846 RepID=A0AAV4NU29_CAEEX|nr:hypothetical protein CEXT_647651 [Caerostris extrusa]
MRIHQEVKITAAEWKAWTVILHFYKLSKLEVINVRAGCLMLNALNKYPRPDEKMFLAVSKDAEKQLEMVDVCHAVVLYDSYSQKGNGLSF